VPDRRRVRIGISVVAAVGAAAALTVTLVAGGPSIVAALRGLPFWTILAVLVLDVVSWFGEAVLFAALAAKPGVRGIGRMIVVYVGGGFPALVTPFGSGGIPGWTYALTREGLSVGEAAAVVWTRALVTSVFFVVAGTVAAATLPVAAAGSGGAWWGVLALAAVLAALTVVALRPERAGAAAERALGARWLGRALGDERAARLSASAGRETTAFASGLRSLVRERPGAFAVAVAGLALSRACLLAILPVIMVGLGWRGALLPVHATVVGVWALASASPTQGGSGTVEAAMTAALSRIVPLPIAGAAALLWRGTTFYLELVVGWALFSRYVVYTPDGPAHAAGGPS
jgi:uncharacterized protein (TIRG00374 family)